MNLILHETVLTTSIQARRRRRRQRRTVGEYAGGMILALCAVGWWGGASRAMRAEDATPPVNPATVAPATAPTSDSSGASTSGTKPAAGITAEAVDPVTSSHSPRVLSSEPLIDRPRVFIDRSKRPAWVETPPVRSGEVHTTTISSGPFATQRGALDRLDEELQAAVRSYIDEQLDSPLAGEKIHYAVKEIKARFVREPVYLEYGEFEGLGTMQDAHAQLVFDASFRTELAERWRQVRTLGRLWNFMCVAGAVLASVGVARIAIHRRVKSSDRAPTSLKFTAGVAILTLLVAGIVLAVRFLEF